MSYIAKTNGATNGQPLEVREGSLTDIAAADRDNWRTVTEILPTIANPIQTVRTTNYFEILPDGRVRMHWNTEDLPDPFVKENLRKHAAAKRWKHSQGGTEVAGVHVQSDDIAIAKIMGAKMALDAGLMTTIRWKSDGGWIDLDQTAMNGVFAGVSAFVQACYAAEETVVDLINDGTYTTRAQIDAHGWP